MGVHSTRWSLMTRPAGRSLGLGPRCLVSSGTVIRTMSVEVHGRLAIQPHPGEADAPPSHRWSFDIMASRMATPHVRGGTSRQSLELRRRTHVAVQQCASISSLR